MSLTNKEIVDTLINLKSRMKVEFARRSCYYGSMTNLASNSYDFNKALKENDVILTEHMKKIKDPLLNVSDYQSSNNFAIENEYVGAIEDAQKLVTSMENEQLYGNSTSCRSACSGLCMGTCFNTCDGCSTGCSNGCSSCTGGCGSGCNNACGGACNVGCGSGCNNACGGACNVGCGSGCTNGCAGCTGCTGSCGGGCQGSCTGGCVSGCEGNCGSNCSTSCGGGAN